MAFPVDILIPELLGELEQRNTVLVAAPPGAGKTTRVPPALLATSWLGAGKVLMLEPRRIAARSAARFMARERGEPVGQTIGYRTRLDTRVSNLTRIEVVTEGILTRMIQSDPALAGVGCVIFDEFHERSLHADLGLALVREAQQALRPDLRLLVMSATLAVEPLKRALDDPLLLQASGRSHPVELRYRPPVRARALVDHVVATISHALDQDSGSVLVFLPGAGEIRRVAAALGERLPADVRLCPLYGQMSPEAQDAAVAPAPDGRRKVVLATAIAESSLTIEGIRVVIDAGLQRRPRFDPNSGMSRLITETVSRASAEQRAGRAGRLEAGVCYRLWSEGEQARLRPHTPPEIEQADLAPLVLELACWGARDPADLTWLDPPPAAHWQQAVDLLVALEALDNAGAATAHGRALLEPGLHPRLAHMLLRGRELGCAGAAAELAALLSDRDLLPPGSGSDLALRVQALHRAWPGVSRGRRNAARQLADALSRGSGDAPPARTGSIGKLLAFAFPDRIARSRGGRGRFLLSNGRGASLPEDDPLAGEEWLVAAELDGKARDSRIFLAASITHEDIEAVLGRRIRVEETADWDEARGRVVARRRRLLGALVLQETELERPSAAVHEAGLLAAIRSRGLDRLAWTESTRQWRARVACLHRLWPDEWPAVDDAALLRSLPDWLGRFVHGARSWREIENLDLRPALRSLIEPGRWQALDELAPAAMLLPTGRKVALDYTGQGGPVLATKLQSVFGWTATPTVARGRVPVVLHLLSPAGRPLAVTSDLASFWANAYPEVRKDMRGRYPKHPWPEDPLSAPPSHGVKRR
ncbi:MAG: ATP-dependent helicase HrpB [Wenzhouxiangella sp.]|nr:MAG: ATP-dependent helicase HrpB [Wenzhouxiangella sp.]